MSEEIVLDCCRCERPIMPWDTQGVIDGEPAHGDCVLEELDEIGMDNDHGCNG